MRYTTAEVGRKEGEAEMRRGLGTEMRREVRRHSMIREETREMRNGIQMPFKNSNIVTQPHPEYRYQIASTIKKYLIIRSPQHYPSAVD